MDLLSAKLVVFLYALLGAAPIGQKHPGSTDSDLASIRAGASRQSQA